MNTTDKGQWSKALEGEVEFWNRVVSEQGWRWPDDYKRRLDPDLELEPAVAEFLPPQPPAEADILDVGAGPLTRLGKKHPGRVLRITAVDPLAEQYERILASHGITPLVRTILGEAGGLAGQFGPDRFDLVYCRNAMDHGYNPLAGIRNCIEVVKPGRTVALFHFTDEAVYENYEGLHQWNFNIDHGRFVIWNPGNRVDVAGELGETVERIDCQMLNQRLLRVAIRKAPR